MSCSVESNPSCYDSVLESKPPVHRYDFTRCCDCFTLPNTHTHTLVQCTRRPTSRDAPSHATHIASPPVHLSFDTRAPTRFAWGLTLTAPGFWNRWCVARERESESCLDLPYVCVCVGWGAVKAVSPALVADAVTGCE